MRLSPSEMQLEAYFSNFCSGRGRRKFPLLSRPVPWDYLWLCETVRTLTMATFSHVCMQYCVQYAYCDAIDSFLLNQKGLVDKYLYIAKNFAIPLCYCVSQYVCIAIEGDDYMPDGWICTYLVFLMVFFFFILRYKKNGHWRRGRGGGWKSATISSVDIGPGLKSQPGCKSFFR